MAKKGTELSIATPPEGPDAYVSDSSLTDPRFDRFRRFRFAERVAPTLANRRDAASLVVSIHGKWGEGKTTVLDFIYGCLQKYEHVVAVKFNPWRCSDEAALLLSFFATIAGDIVHIPAALPHHVVLEPGKQITYVIVKVTD